MSEAAQGPLAVMLRDGLSWPEAAVICVAIAALACR